MQTLLINPRRRKTKAGTRRKGRSAAQKAATRRLVAMNRSKNPAPRRRAKRRANPIMSYSRVKRSARRAVSRIRRRRNPIAARGGSLTSLRTYMGPIKDAAAMGVGAVLIDVLFAYINRYLPASVKRVPGQVGLGDAVKAVITVALGQVLAGPTKGYSRKAAVGSLVVQARDLAVALLPASVTGAGLGFVNPGVVVPNMTGRVNSNMANRGGMGAFTGGRAQTPLLAAYTGMGPGSSPLLSRMPARRV